MLIDLQLHSKFSDGYLTPSELVKFAKKRQVKVIALTDHNTTAGLKEFRAAAKKEKIKTITGLELYVKYKNKKMNFLWYNFDENNLKLQKLLKNTRHRRFLAAKKILLKLKKIGYKINIEKILDSFDNYIPVNRLGDKVIENKYNYNLIVKKIKEKMPKKVKLILPLREEDVLKELFFNKNIGRLNESYIDAERLIKMKKDIGGQIVFCHPGKYNKYAKNMTERLRAAGIIDGIEVLSPHHSIGSIMYSQFLSEKLDLIATGGSDFHRFEESGFLINDAWDWFKIDTKYLRRVDEVINYKKDFKKSKKVV
jgi:hypothetical protein